ALVAASGSGVLARVSVGTETAELTEARLRTRSHKEWLPNTKLGCLVKDMKIKSLKIYLFSLSIKESEIIDFFLGASLKDEVLKIMPVFKAFVAIGNYNGHVGLGVERCKEVATATHEAMILAKLSIVHGKRSAKTHTIPCRVTGHCGSVLVCLIPAPRGTGIISVPTYSYLTSDLWKETVFTKSPYQQFTDHLVETHTRVSLQRTQAPAVATT
ncbi:hypothetical protein EI555_008126, partial [Monodon monoceros]